MFLWYAKSARSDSRASGMSDSATLSSKCWLNRVPSKSPCPNGCTRPYTGDIGIVGRMPGYYALYVGAAAIVCARPRWRDRISGVGELESVFKVAEAV